MLRNDILNSQIQVETVGRSRSSLSGRRAARELLLLGTTANLSPERKERISRILGGALDWGYLLHLATQHGVTPLIAYNLTTAGLASQVPDSNLARLQQIYHKNLFRNLILAHELTGVLAVFYQHGILAIVLKGTVLAEHLYGNPALRTVGDMDVLVPPEKMHSARSLLLEMGYRQFTSPSWHHAFHEAPYCRLAQFPLFIELHWNLDDEKLVTISRQQVWNRAQRLPTQEQAGMVLSPEDTLLFLSNHLSKHSTHLLRSLNDIAELLKKYDSILDWDYALAATHSWGVEAAVYYALRRSQELLGAPVPAYVIRAIKPRVWRRRLIDFLISRDFFISSTHRARLRDETYTVARSLMMNNVSQTILILARNHGRSNRITWFRTAIWVILVFGAALARSLFRVVSGRK